MNHTPNARAEARSRAMRRLQSMTIGTAMLGVAATGGFGLLAAATYAGAGSPAVDDGSDVGLGFTLGDEDDDDRSFVWQPERVPLAIGSLPRADASTGGS